MNECEFEFIIAGAGLSGIIAGIELLRMNKRCLILEKNPGMSRPLCGEYLTPKGHQLINDLDLSCMLSDFHPLLGMELISPSGKKIKTFFPENQKGISLNRKIFQERLMNYYLSLGGRLLTGVEIQNIEITPQNVMIKTNEKKFISQWLIGADGRLSQVAKLTGLEGLKRPHKKMALHCYLKPKKSFERLGQMYILPGGQYIGINPISQSEVNFSIVTEFDEIKKAGGVKNFINFWIMKEPHLSKSFSPLTDEEIKTISPITRKASRISTQRVTLIGDASGFIDPLTGEGMTTAIATAKLLTQEIKKSEDIQEAFYSYESKRKSEFLEKENFNLLLQKIIKREMICETIAILLESSMKLRSLFIGIIGNIYTPRMALKKLFSP